jgi:DNA (cytosine-5)-methyltransferase 1
MLTFVDLFAGAGGLSEGFIDQGFKPVAHVDEDRSACATLQTRLIYHYLSGHANVAVYHDYTLGKINRKDFLELVPTRLINSIYNTSIGEETMDTLMNAIQQRLADEGIRRLDVLLGAAPCQAYSVIGRSANRRKNPSDVRLGLYKYYVRFLKLLAPTCFVFENVPGILSVGDGKIFSELKDALMAQGYVVGYRAVKAEEHGVLQKRRRIIVFGWRKRLHIDFPEFPTFVQQSLVSEVLDDLPQVQPGHDASNQGYISPPTPYLRRMKLRQKSDKLTLHLARPQNERDRKIYRSVVETWMEEQKHVRYQQLPEALRTRTNITSFTDRYKVVPANLSHSHTVLAHIAKDGHYYIHPDVAQRRSLTVREAARLQSFPDSYFFEGERASKFRQIGNAVPPLLSSAVAAAIRRVIV